MRVVLTFAASAALLTLSACGDRDANSGADSGPDPNQQSIEAPYSSSAAGADPAGTNGAARPEGATDPIRSPDGTSTPPP